jgi:hypothetical protein
MQRNPSNLLKLYRNGDRGCARLLEIIHAENRKGEDGATTVLVDVHTPILEEKLDSLKSKLKKSRLTADDVRGEFCCDLFKAIKALRTKVINPVDAIRYMRKTLRWTLPHLLKERSPDIYPPSSTKSDRKAKGLTTERLRYRNVDVNQRSKAARDEREENELRIDVALLPGVEKEITRLRLAGTAKSEIQGQLGLSRKQLATILRKIGKSFGISDRATP